MKSFLIAVLLLLSPISTGLIAAEPTGIAQPAETAPLKETENLDLSQAEQELIELLDEYQEKQVIFWKKRREGAKRNEDGILVIVKTDLFDPSTEFIPLLQAFEEAHRGEEVGLQALTQIFNEAGRGGGENSPAYLARKESLTYIESYAKFYAVIGLLDRATSGDFDSSVAVAAQSIVNSTEASPRVQALASYILSKWWVAQLKRRGPSEKRKQALLDGAESRMSGSYELDRINRFLDSVPDSEELSRKAKESLEILDALAKDENSPRLLKRVPVDPKYRIIRYVEDESKRRISDVVASYLFKERHLQSGMPAPLLELNLVNGGSWSMANQLGKYVVVQFSFTGCGPCARMYPVLKELAEEYPEDISIVTIMRDETPENAIQGIEDGKLTWNITCDGNPGEVTTHWAVRGFPATYVIDREGKIVYSNMAGRLLKEKFTGLLDNEKTATATN